jgi:hypothetical protein
MISPIVRNFLVSKQNYRHLAPIVNLISKRYYLAMSARETAELLVERF